MIYLNITVTCILLIAFSSCGTSVGTKQKEEDLEKVSVGMSIMEVENLLVKPESLSRDASGNINYLYLYSKIRISARSYIPIVNLFGTNAKMESQNFSVYFDRSGRVKNFGLVGSSQDPNNRFRDTSNSYTRPSDQSYKNADSYTKSSKTPTLSKQQAKRELLNKYLSKEITRPEYVQLLREIDLNFD